MNSNVINHFNENDYLFHGTSTLYFDYFKKHGINGRFPDLYYDPLKELYDFIREDKDLNDLLTKFHNSSYLDEFFIRQESIRENNKKKEIWMYNKLESTKKFSNGRPNGEGISVFMNYLRTNYNVIITKNPNIKTKLDNLINIFDKDNSKGITLAFSKKDLKKHCSGFESIQDFTNRVALLSEESSNTFVHYCNIIPHIIYIVDLTNEDQPKLLPLLSDEAQEYVKKLTSPQIPSIKLTEGVETFVPVEELHKYKLIPILSTDPDTLFTSDLEVYKDHNIILKELNNNNISITLLPKRGGKRKKTNKKKSSKSIKSKKSRKQRGGGNNKLVKNCLDTFVKSKIEKEQETSKQFYDELEKILKMNAKKNKTLKKEDKEKIKKDLERIKKGRKMSKSRKNIESFKKLYTKLYCNPTCNGTMLESGNELSPEYYKAYKDNKQLINYDKSERKKIFGNKTNVLSDGFYEKAPKKYVDNIKKEGAISLCSPIVK